MAKEEKLQSDIVVRFSQLYPDKRGQLYHPANERNNKLQAIRAKAIGIFPGVADLIYFDDEIDVATELKVPGSYHDRYTVEGQMNWGKIWEAKGRIWRLCRTVDEAINCYDGNPKGLTTKEVKTMLKTQKTKNIRF